MRGRCELTASLEHCPEMRMTPHIFCPCHRGLRCCDSKKVLDMHWWLTRTLLCMEQLRSICSSEACTRLMLVTGDCNSLPRWGEYRRLIYTTGIRYQTLVCKHFVANPLQPDAPFPLVFHALCAQLAEGSLTCLVGVSFSVCSYL